MNRIALFVYLVIMSGMQMFAQHSDHLRFKSITVNENLSHSDVTTVVQDSMGFIWIGTNKGLNKFDGYSIHTIKHQIEDPNSLPGNRIKKLFVDRYGIIWVAIENMGIYRFHPERLEYHKVKLSFGETEDYNFANCEIILADNGDVWLHTGNSGLIEFKIAADGQIVEQYVHDFKELNQGVQYAIKSLVAVDGYIYCWLANDRIVYLPKNRSAFQELYIDKKIVKQITGILALNSGLLISSPTSLFRYDFPLSHSEPSATFTFKDKTLGNKSNLIQDHKGNLWFSTISDLNKIINPITGAGDQELVVQNYKIKNINTLFEDSYGVMWIGSGGYGIHYTNLRKKEFYHIPGSSEKTSLISAIYTDEFKRIWVGSTQNLEIYEPQIFPQQYVLKAALEDGLWISQIFEDSRHNIWVASRHRGLFRAVIKEDRILMTSINEVLGKDLSEMDNIMRMTEDASGRLWVSTFLKGIYILDFEQGKVDRLISDPQTPNSLSSNKMTDVYYDALEDAIWAGTRDSGVNKIQFSDASNYRIQHFTHDIEDTLSISNNHAWQFLRETDGTFWVTTLGGGLNQIIRRDSIDSYSFKRYTTENGLIDNDVEGIAEDQEGNLWLSGVGLSRFNPESGSIEHFNFQDGLQSNSFKVGAVFQDPAREWLYFGGINGLNYFNPQSIIADTLLPKVHITRIQVKNGEHSTDFNQLEKDAMLKFASGFNNLTFNFVALQYNAPEKNKYEYRLLGSDEQWTSTTFPNLTANYLNLPPGNYKFQVRASNGDGKWNPEISQVMFKIKKPWYGTYLAYMGYFLIIGLSLYLFRRITENRVQLENELILAEKEHELDRSKLSFFTRISHELRTPLTLIKGPLEELLFHPNLGQITKNKLELMRKSTERLLNLTNQLLDFRKLETGNMQLLAYEDNFVKFAKELFLVFSQSASSKEISYQFKCEEAHIRMVFDHEKMEIILMNLLSNAYKYSPQKGVVTMEITIKGSRQNSAVWKEGVLIDNFVVVEVSDTGKGMSEASIDKVFNPYYQVRQVSTSSPVGTGLGLSLVKGFVELHKGTVSIKSAPDKGATFALHLPLGKEHLPADQLIKVEAGSEMLTPYIIEESTKSDIELKEHFVDELKSKNKKYKLLVVEDNQDLANYICSLLEDEFYIECAGNGQEGYECALEFEPDIILSDVMMPVLDGIAMCEKIKSDDKTAHIPIIMLTARTSIVYQLNGLEMGAEDFISKPFSISILRSKIRTLLKNRALQREFYRKQLFFEATQESHLNQDEQMVYDAIKYIEAHLDDVNLDVQSLSNALCQSQSNLYRKVKLVTGNSVVELIRDVRIKNAAQLLKEKKYSVNEVAYLTGFSSVKYFRKCFKKVYHVNPSEFYQEDIALKISTFREA